MQYPLLGLAPSNNTASEDCDINATLSLHSHWIYVSFGTCVVNGRQYLSFFVGLLSILSWICAQLPQIVVNCKTGEADKSLSFWFLLLWQFSDTANLLGAILTNQLITQVLLAAYFVFIDTVTLTQFLFHYFRKRGLAGLREAFKSKRDYILRMRAKSYGTVQKTLLVLLLPCASTLYWYSSQHGYSTERWKSRTLLGEGEKVIDVQDVKFMIGYILGSISAVMYFFALPPQIIKNFKRKSVSGLSLTMFLFVTMGDSTYCVSVLLYSVDRVFIIRSLPWLLGSAWSVIFDVFLVAQILVYRCLESRSRLH